MTKILYILAQSLDPNTGGVQRVTYNLGRFFTQQGVTVSYFSFAREGHVKEVYGTLYRATQDGQYRNAANRADLVELLRSWQPAIVINQMPYIQELYPLLQAQRAEQGFFLIGCLHNSLFSVVNNVRDAIKRTIPAPLRWLVDNAMGAKLMLQAHKLKHGKALRAILDTHDRFVLLTPPNRQELQYFIGDYNSEKVLAIPNSIQAEGNGEGVKQKKVLHVGRLNVAQKRSDLLLEFWEKCYSSLPDWEFDIVGDGPYMSQLKQRIASRKIPRVFLKGYQQPDAYFQQASAFMMPSAYEGFPNTILEAQSFGCVVLAFNSYAALEWIVNDREDALLSRAFDTDQMAGQMLELAADKQQLTQMGRAALENVKRFSLEQVGRTWMKLFEQVTG